MATVKEKVNIPSAPIPSKVRLSALPEPSPILRTVEDGGDINEHIVPLEIEEVEEKDGIKEGSKEGNILIRVYSDKPVEVVFEGDITGNQLDRAWLMVMKQYRVWKASLVKKDGESKKGGN